MLATHGFLVHRLIGLTGRALLAGSIETVLVLMDYDSFRGSLYHAQRQAELKAVA
jgi:hypothetical protein